MHTAIFLIECSHAVCLHHWIEHITRDPIQELFQSEYEVLPGPSSTQFTTTMASSYRDLSLSLVVTDKLCCHAARSVSAPSPTQSDQNICPSPFTQLFALSRSHVVVTSHIHLSLRISVVEGTLFCTFHFRIFQIAPPDCFPTQLFFSNGSGYLKHWPRSTVFHNKVKGHSV